MNNETAHIIRHMSVCELAAYLAIGGRVPDGMPAGLAEAAIEYHVGDVAPVCDVDVACAAVDPPAPLARIDGEAAARAAVA